MTTATDALDWRKLDRAALDRAFNNAAAVPGSADIVAGWEARSAALRAEPGHILDLRYGSKPRNRIDVVRAPRATKTLAFIHGGYWQMRSKETFTFVSEGPLAHGINLAHIGYTLAPDARLDEIVAEIDAALAFLVIELPRLGLDPGALWVSGWSAGAHLAAMMLDRPMVCGALLVSGLYDLEPIRHCYVNDKLGLDAASAVRNSPLGHISPRSAPAALVAGGAELPLMRQQTAEYAAALLAAKQPCRYEEVPGADHFSILEDMARPEGRVTRLLLDLIARSETEARARPASGQIAQ